MNSDSLLPPFTMQVKLTLFPMSSNVHMVVRLVWNFKQLADNSIGKTPAIALFATSARYKREDYRSSEFAPKILARNGITVLMKVSDKCRLKKSQTDVLSRVIIQLQLIHDTSYMKLSKHTSMDFQTI